MTDYISKIVLEEVPVVKEDDKVANVIEIAQEYRIQTVPVVDEKGRLVGLVTYRDLLEKRVSPLSKVKSVMNRPHKIVEDESLLDIARKFYTTKFKQIPVVDKNMKVIALAHRDLLAKYLIERGYIQNMSVGKIATRDVITCSPDDLVAKVRWEMIRNAISRMPVVQNGRLVGIISMRDIVEKLYYAYIAERPDIGGYVSEEEILAAPVKVIMTTNVVTAYEDEDVLSVLDKMLKHKISGLPVLRGEVLTGIFSGYDLLRAYLQKELTVEIPVRAHIEAELDETTEKYIHKVVSNYYAKFAKIVDVIDFKIHVKVYECEPGEDERRKRCKYSVHAYIKHDYGEHSIQVTDWNPGKAVRDALYLLYRNVLKHLDKVRTKVRGVYPYEEDIYT